MRIGVDLGGTKIEALLFDESESVLRRMRVDTPQGDYSATLDRVVELVTELQRRAHGRATVGIGTPGARSQQTGLMKNCNSTCLNQRPLLEDIQARLGCAVRLANDADCFALSEAVDGAAAEHEVVFGVILGTGVGGGIVVNRRLLSGPNSIAGEWGHNPMPGIGSHFLDEQRPCYCGRVNCIETFLSGPGLATTYYRLSGQQLTAEQVVQRMDRDPDASHAFDLYQRQLSAALAQVVNILDPHAIVLGGGLSNVAQLYSGVPAMWDKFIFSDQIATQLLPPKFGDSSGVRGAARLWS